MTSYADYCNHMASVVAPHYLSAETRWKLPVLYAAMLGRPIESARISANEVLYLTFKGGGRLAVHDTGQSCCESRYMTTDDDLASFVGATLVDVSVEDGPNVPYGDEYTSDYHETQFVRISTSAGTITLVTHNEHNGYYGGFDIVTEWRD